MMARLGDICEIVSGTTPKSNVPEYWDGEINWVTPAELNDDTIIVHESQRKITEQAVKDSSLRPFPAGTVILSSRAPIGKVAIAGVEMYCNQGFKNLICSEKIYNKYLFWFLKGKTDFLNSLGRGATFKEISKSIVENIDIPLPPIEKQKNCAVILDKLNELISLRKEQLSKLDELVKVRFMEMFGDPVLNPHNYPKYKLGELSLKISDGVHAKPEYVKDGKTFLSVVNINKRKVDFKNCKFVSEEAYQKMIKSTCPQRGDVLYTKVGATYGIPAYVDTDREFCLYVSVCLIKPNHNLINSKFLAISMDMPYIKRQADARVKGIGVPDLHLNQISEFDILCPPRKMQDSFVSYIEHIERQQLTIQQSMDKLEVLKKSLMQEYFG